MEMINSVCDEREIGEEMRGRLNRDYEQFMCSAYKVKREG